MIVKNPETYQPVLIAIESVLQSHFPLLSGTALSAIADDIGTAVETTGVLRDANRCAVAFCDEDAIWDSVYCTRHIKGKP